MIDELMRLNMPPVEDVQKKRDTISIVEKEPLEEIRECSNIYVRPIYDTLIKVARNRMILARRGVVERLHIAAMSLPKGFSLVVYDGWRSVDLQRAVYELIAARAKGRDEAETYAYNIDGPCGDVQYPVTDPPHCTGGSVDVGILGPDGNPWPMGTELDSVSRLSATVTLERLGEHADQRALLGRRLLFNTMLSAGFTNYPAEWWHYDFGNAFWRHYGKLPPGPVYRSII